MNPRDHDITLELDRINLTVNPLIGCSIMSLMIRCDDRPWTPVLRTMPQNADSSSNAGSFSMLPWTNRVKDARFSFNTKDHQLSANASDQSAIHGVVRDHPWAIADRSPITARFVFDSRRVDTDSINYPFRFGAVQRFEIGPDHVEIDLSITNLDTQAIPVGCGHHPYIHRHLYTQDDDLQIQLEVAGRYPTQGCIPIGDPESDSICQAFADGEPIGNPGLDDVFAGFGGKAMFKWPTSNVRMSMECSQNLGHVVIYTPKDIDGNPDEFVCVEPVTMVNDGFNRLALDKEDTGVVILKPDESLRTRMTLRFA